MRRSQKAHSVADSGVTDALQPGYCIETRVIRRQTLASFGIIATARQPRLAMYYFLNA